MRTVPTILLALTAGLAVASPTHADGICVNAGASVAGSTASPGPKCQPYNDVTNCITGGVANDVVRAGVWVCIPWF